MLLSGCALGRCGAAISPDEVDSSHRPALSWTKDLVERFKAYGSSALNGSEKVRSQDRR